MELIEKTKVDTAYRKEIIDGYALGQLSRNLSVLARKEVLTGKAKFGIFGDGKEVAQLAMAKFFKKGDWRSGYYRDQTFVLATGMCSPEEFFSLIYGDTDTQNNPHNSGRSFNNHFATRFIDEQGEWMNQTILKNSSGDISPTGGQMPRLVGLAYASKLYRQNRQLSYLKKFSIEGNEVAFGTIGDSSAAEGHFFETMNAAGILQIPLALAVWDDGYGISVPVELQVIKGSISETLKGFEKTKSSNGILIYKAKGWDYPSLVKMFEEGINICRNEHIPVLFHVTELTQPLGHSTSGSHERYKSKERLDWEMEFDCLVKMREWILQESIATAEELDIIEAQAAEQARNARDNAKAKYQQPIKDEVNAMIQLIEGRTCNCREDDKKNKIDAELKFLKSLKAPIRRDLFSSGKKILRNICLECKKKGDLQLKLRNWLNYNYALNHERYSSTLYNESARSALNVQEIKPVYSIDSPTMVGREILRDNFDNLFSKYPNLIAFGEDVGKIGGVNQCFEGLQSKYGELRVTDSGIRETTIIGQGIGMAMRGLRPIAEIQYLDYLLFGLQTLSDDLATLHYRTKAAQAAPLIIRTRGHRLEGIWHSGSPLGMLVNALRGIYICVPRDLTRAAGFYNALLEGDDPALIIEPLNGYRLKEVKPDNLFEFKITPGIAEVLVPGNDVTLVTYGSCVKIAQEALEQLMDFNISVELIDVQTLIPFDLQKTILTSMQKTNRIVFFDEDVPGGATAYMMKKVLEDQGGYFYLDSPPVTLTAQEHRPAYSSDGDYFSNPNAEDVFETIYKIMHEAEPDRFPLLY